MRTIASAILGLSLAMIIGQAFKSGNPFIMAAAVGLALGVAVILHKAGRDREDEL